jgi:hypothetical protein
MMCLNDAYDHELWMGIVSIWKKLFEKRIHPTNARVSTKEWKWTMGLIDEIYCMGASGDVKMIMVVVVMFVVMVAFSLRGSCVRGSMPQLISFSLTVFQ